MAVTRERPASTARVHLVPKEHGASFMSVHALLLGLVAGFAAGGRDPWGVLLAVAFELLFLPLAGAVSVITHRALATRARHRTIALAAALGIVSLLTLLVGPPRQLLELGLVGVAVGVGYAAVRRTAGARAVATQLAAIAGISLLAPLAWLLVTGATGRWPLSAPAAFLSFGGTVPYVRERVRRRRVNQLTLGDRLRGGSLAVAWQGVALVAAVALATTGVTTWVVPVAFVPGAVKTALGIARVERRPPIARIGILETVVSTVFAIAVGIGLGIAP